MKNRIVFSVLLVMVWLAVGSVYRTVQGPVEGAIAAQQVQDSAVTYSASRALTGQYRIPTIVGWAVLVLLAITWLPVLLRRSRDAGPLAVLIVATMLVAGCRGPYQQEVIKEIESNQTAFLVRLEGANKADQTKFMSVEYLEKAKVATKRVVIPTRQHDLGRAWWDFEWIPTMKVITVDRTPVTREWTKAADKGTSATDQAIVVETNESIDFYTGVVCSAFVSEEDASKFLYYYAGKPLTEVMDTNVRGFVQSELWKRFGVLPLTDAKKQKKEIMDAVYKGAKEFFAPQGITITVLGGAEGLTYRDERIQAAINQAFIAENDKKVAIEEQAAQVTRNQTKVQIATADRQAAEEFAKAREAMIARTELDIKKMYAEATLKAADKVGSINVSGILPQNSNLLFGLDRQFTAPSAQK